MARQVAITRRARLLIVVRRGGRLPIETPAHPPFFNARCVSIEREARRRSRQVGILHDRVADVPADTRISTYQRIHTNSPLLFLR